MPHQIIRLDLNHIAAHLEGLEETIISKLIDRAQFCVNESVYETGKSGFTGEPTRCLFDVRMHYHEQMDALFGRFCTPEERPFSLDLPGPLRKVTLPATGLQIDNFNLVNFTEPIRRHYLELVKSICRPSDDGQYGSSVEHDVYAIQAISRRIHYGAFYVAECKYQSNPEKFDSLAKKGDKSALEHLLTRKEVEDRIINRVAQKTHEIQKMVNPAIRHVVDADLLVQFYRDIVIPLTKQGEVAYLVHRREQETRAARCSPVHSPV